MVPGQRMPFSRGLLVQLVRIHTWVALLRYDLCDGGPAAVEDADERHGHCRHAASTPQESKMISGKPGSLAKITRLHPRRFVDPCKNAL